VLLGGLLIWGLQPGPLLFVEQKDFVWGLIASMYLGNIVGLIIVLTMVPFFAAILRVPFSIIAPIILVICAIGAYTVHNNTFNVVMMLVFGGLCCRTLWPAADPRSAQVRVQALWRWRHSATASIRKSSRRPCLQAPPILVCAPLIQPQPGRR